MLIERCRPLKDNWSAGRILREAELSKPAQAAVKAYERARHFPRHRFDGRIQASVFRHGVTTTCWGRTSELSLDGIGATLSGELQVGEVVSLEFSIPIPPNLMKVRAVVRCCQGLRYGFEFLVVTHEQKQILHQICTGLPPSP
jgi:PilZ domain